MPFHLFSLLASATSIPFLCLSLFPFSPLRLLHTAHATRFARSVPLALSVPTRSTFLSLPIIDIYSLRFHLLFHSHPYLSPNASQSLILNPHVSSFPLPPLPLPLPPNPLRPRPCSPLRPPIIDLRSGFRWSP